MPWTLAKPFFPSMGLIALVDGTFALRTNRWVLLILSSVQVFTSAGIIFGWASLVVVLKEAGVYADACSTATAAASGGGGSS